MGKFTINHDVKQSAEQTFQRVQEILTKGDELKKIDPKIQCHFDAQTKTCQILGSQFKADLQVASQPSGAQILVTVDLPLLLMPFKSQISQSLLRLFEKHLG
jgi:hypothetical protein